MGGALSLYLLFDLKILPLYMLHSLDWTNLLQCQHQWPHLLGHWTTAMKWFLLRLASFSLLWTRLCMKEAMASRKTWKPTTTYSGRRWFPHLQTLTRQQCYRSDIDMFNVYRSRLMLKASMTFSPQLFWRAHHTIRFISGKYFLKIFVRCQMIFK